MAMNAFDIDAVLNGISGADYNPDTDGPSDPDAPSWRIWTSSAQAHAALAARLAKYRDVRATDCSDNLDKVDREDGGLFGCWIVTVINPESWRGLHLMDEGWTHRNPKDLADWMRRWAAHVRTGGSLGIRPDEVARAAGMEAAANTWEAAAKLVDRLTTVGS